jgi:AraC-like DNA-binding protein
LQLLDILWRNLGLNPGRQPVRPFISAPALPAVTAARRFLIESDDQAPLHDIAQKIGYQQDYLNRVLKTATGLTLGQMRSQLRVTRAQRLLRESRKIVDVAERLGFSDGNYFARWFRLQTGVTPRQWQRKVGLPSSPR